MKLVTDSDNRPLKPGQVLHKCDVCGELGTWDREWKWYGPVEPEYATDIVKTCSEKCRDIGIDKVDAMYVAKVRARGGKVRRVKQ